MDCRHVNKLLVAYMEGELPDSVSRQVEEHLQQCEDCAKKYARMQKMVHLMKRLPSISPSPGIVQNVMEKIEEENKPARTNFFARFKLIPKKVMVAAAAFMLLAAVLYGTLNFFVGHSSFQFQSWAATVQAAPHNLEESGWWAWRKKAADEIVLPEDKNVGIIFGGILDQPERVNIIVKWINPDGILFQQTSFIGNLSPGLCAFMSTLNIDDHEPINRKEKINEASFQGEVSYSKTEGILKDFPGIWHLEIYINNSLQSTLQIRV